MRSPLKLLLLYHIKQKIFYVAVHLFSNRSQEMSKCGKIISGTLGCASRATFLFFLHFDIICDLLLNRWTATWNLFCWTGTWMTSVVTRALCETSISRTSFWFGFVRFNKIKVSCIFTPCFDFILFLPAFYYSKKQIDVTFSCVCPRKV